MDGHTEPRYTNLTRTAYKGDMVSLFAAAEAVEQLVAQPGWQHVVRLIELDGAEIEAKLSGLLSSRAEYAHWTARRAGLRGFMEAAHAIVAVAAKTRAEQQRKHEATAETVA